MSTYSIILKSKLEGAKRLDAEYYQPEYLHALEKVRECPGGVFPITDLLSRKVVTGSTPKRRDCLGDGTDIKFVKTDVLREGMILFDQSECLPEKESKKNSEPKTGDILITIIGATYDIVGRVARVHDDDPRMNINQNIALLRPKEKLLSSYLSLFLQGGYGRDQLWQQSRQTEQVNLNCREVERVIVPLPKSDFLELVDKMVLDAHSFIGESIKIYSQAEQMLLKELGLEHFEEDGELWTIVQLSDVKAAGRMDAEYFQPKYAKLFKQLKKCSSRPLGELVTMKKGIEPGSEAYTDEGKLFIRVSNISRFGLADKDQKHLSDQLYKELKDDYAPKIGEILLTKDATPGIACVLTEKVECVVSGGVLRLKLKESMDAEYLALCINSLVGRLQAERDAGGSIIAHWKPEQIKQVQIPVLPETTQQKITELVRASHAARAKAHELLEEAKRTVEDWIESRQKNGGHS